MSDNSRGNEMPDLIAETNEIDASHLQDWVLHKVLNHFEVFPDLAFLILDGIDAEVKPLNLSFLEVIFDDLFDRVYPIVLQFVYRTLHEAVLFSLVLLKANRLSFVLR